MEMNVEVDEQEVINNMDATEIFDKSSMDGSHCKTHFGDVLLEEFSLSEIIEYYGEEDLLHEIGSDAAIKHFGIDVAK